MPLTWKTSVIIYFPTTLIWPHSSVRINLKTINNRFYKICAEIFILLMFLEASPLNQAWYTVKTTFQTDQCTHRLMKVKWCQSVTTRTGNFLQFLPFQCAICNLSDITRLPTPVSNPALLFFLLVLTYSDPPASIKNKAPDPLSAAKSPLSLYPVTTTYWLIITIINLAGYKTKKARARAREREREKGEF